MQNYRPFNWRLPKIPPKESSTKRPLEYEIFGGRRKCCQKYRYILRFISKFHSWAPLMHAELRKPVLKSLWVWQPLILVFYQQPHIYFEKNMAATHFHLNKFAAANKLWKINCQNFGTNLPRYLCDKKELKEYPKRKLKKYSNRHNLTLLFVYVEISLHC